MESLGTEAEDELKEKKEEETAEAHMKAAVISAIIFFNIIRITPKADLPKVA
jgi:predicted nucleic acid-binding protein